MARYEITGPDGAKYEITAPDGASEQDALAYLQKQLAGGAPTKAPEPAPQRSHGIIPAALEGMAQGLSLGFADEIEGAARAAYGKLTGDQTSFGDLYGAGVAIPRQRIAEARASSPVSFGVGEIGAGLALPFGAARLGVGALSGAAGRTLGARTLAGASEGAVYGGLAGAGTSEGGLIERAKGAGGGALLGGLIGGAAPSVVDAVGSVASGIARPFRAASNPQGVAAEKFAEAITRDNPVGGAGRFAARATDLMAINPSARIVDAGGDNVHGLMRAAANVPNEARDSIKRFVDARQGNQYARIERSLVDTMGEGGMARGGYHGELDRLARQMDDIGAQHIQPALQIETPMTPRLRNVLSRPTTQDLQRSVERKLADEGLPIGFETRTAMLHRLKVELDDQIGMSRRAEQMGNRPQAGMDTRTLTILKRDLMNAIDNPAYKAGLRSYASTAQLRNAAEDGFDAFRTQQPEQIRAALANMESAPMRDFYRFGAMRAIIEKTRQGNALRDRTENVFASPEMQMKLQAVFPSQGQLRNFQRFLVSEAKMADSRKALQGNSTTARQLAEGGEAGKTAGMITSLMNAAGGSWQSAMNLLAQGYNRFTGLTPRVAGDIMELGASRDPAVIWSLAQQGMERATQVPAQRARTAQQLTATGSLLASSNAPLEINSTARGILGDD